MIILAKPSISPYLSLTLCELEEPVVLAEPMRLPMKPSLHILPEQTLQSDPRKAYRSLLLTNSENALALLYRLIPHDDRILKTKIFKDKVLFRKALAQSFTDFFFEELTLNELDQYTPNPQHFPLILKPSTGISSIGVCLVKTPQDWPAAKKYLREELSKYQANYSSAVIESEKLILEQYIEGTELAIDGYFNSDAEPVILNILEHLFLNSNDTSDRIYTTRRSLIRKYYGSIMAFLKHFGDAFDLKRFPFHLEVRITQDGRIIPIELNPLRFSGLGTTEIAEYAYGINVYKHFLREKAPNWEYLLNESASREDDSHYTFMCADLTTPYFKQPNLKIHDRAFYKTFSEVLEYRILDEQETSTFAVVFFRSDEVSENLKFLAMDFEPFFELPSKQQGRKN